MQIIDQLETTKRGPYGGGIGVVGFNGAMDIALALRTMVIPAAAKECFFKYTGGQKRREWLVHLQASTYLSPCMLGTVTLRLEPLLCSACKY